MPTRCLALTKAGPRCQNHRAHGSSFCHLHQEDASVAAPRAFVAYKWETDEHNAWVRKFATDLRYNGVEALVDVWNVRAGDSFTDYMTSGISKSEVLLFIITTAAVQAVEAPAGQDTPIKFEMQLANARRLSSDPFRLIGIYREGPHPPAHLRDHRYIDFRNDSQYTESLEVLVRDIHGLTDQPEVIPFEAALWSKDLEEHLEEQEYHNAWRALEKALAAGHPEPLSLLFKTWDRLDLCDEEDDGLGSWIVDRFVEAGESAIIYLKRNVGDSDERLARRSLIILWSMETPRAKSVILAALESPLYGIWDMAAACLVDRPSEENIPALVNALLSGRHSESVFEALARMPESYGQLADLLESDEQHKREVAIAAFAYIGTPAEVTLEALRDQGSARTQQLCNDLILKSNDDSYEVPNG